MNFRVHLSLAVAAGLLSGAGAAVADGLDILAGKALFERRWVQAPASTKSADGLGPLFNAHACSSCHKDGGPARFVVDGDSVGVRGLVVRVGTAEGAPDPWYGRQIQERAIAGLIPEARIRPRLEAVSVGDASLQRIVPVLEVTGPPLASAIRIEARAAPSLKGRALIAAVEEAAVLALADPDDADGDGISGRARMVRDAQGTSVLGRFGLKAHAATIADQVADAAAFDMGLSSTRRPLPYGDCTVLERECRANFNGETAPGAHELSDEMVTLMAGFVASLKRPPLADDPRGAKLFADTGCSACHVPALAGAGGNQAGIFTDLLLHDLGPGLAGAIGEPGAAAGEWRTAPLIDLDPRLRLRRFLHDGRAATVEEAVLWHAGEAEGSATRFRALPDEERQALIGYVNRL